jgi:hypothetical protein
VYGHLDVQPAKLVSGGSSSRSTGVVLKGCFVAFNTTPVLHRCHPHHYASLTLLEHCIMIIAC